MTDKAELIKIAAELAMCKDMPSTVFEDWNFPKSVSMKQQCRVIGAAFQAHSQCKHLAVRLRMIADRIKE